MSLVPDRINLAIAAAVIIASNDGSPVTQREVSRQLSLPERHFEASLQALARAGILKSIRGAHGGYVLSDDPQLVTCAAIAIGVMDTDDDPIGSTVPGIDLVVGAALAQAEADLLARLAQTSVADLLRKATEGARLAQAPMSSSNFGVPQ